jgi:hypothetical protein
MGRHRAGRQAPCGGRMTTAMAMPNAMHHRLIAAAIVPSLKLLV